MLQALNSFSHIFSALSPFEEMDSHGTSWADQWDDGPDPLNGSNQSKKKSNKDKVLDKTKTVASSGVKKLKEGTSVSLQWIKTKYNKTTQKH